MSIRALKNLKTNTSGGLRFLFASVMFWLMVCLLSVPTAVQAAEKQRPNIIFIMADDKNQVFADGSHMPLNQSIYPRNTACHDSVQFRSSQANSVGLTTVYYIK